MILKMEIFSRMSQLLFTINQNWLVNYIIAKLQKMTKSIPLKLLKQVWS